MKLPVQPQHVSPGCKIKAPIFPHEKAIHELREPRFVTHSPDNHLRPHVRGYLEALIREGIGVVLIVVADSGFVSDEPWLSDLVDGLFVRENGGFDFAAWAHVLQLQNQLHDADALYLLNDSVLGPVSADAFHTAIERVRSTPGDLVGMTENYDRGWHIQSYFLVLRQQALHSTAWRKFLHHIESLANKEDAIDVYEVKLAAEMVKAGLRAGVAFKTNFRSDPTVYRWRELLEDGFPFIKIKTIRDNIPDVDNSGWRLALMDQGFDVSIADELLGTTSRKTERASCKSMR